MVVTVNMDQSAELLEGLSSEQQKLSAIDGILDRTDRISLSIDNSSGTAAAPAFYGGLEGNFGYFTANTALKFSREWKRETDSSVVYFHSDQNALDVMIPRSGIVLFSQGIWLKYTAGPMQNGSCSSPMRCHGRWATGSRRCTWKVLMTSGI